MALIVVVGALGACGTIGESGSPAPEAPNIDVRTIPEAVPHPELLSRYGNPESYEVFGQRYQVITDAHDYVERGIASWYGPDFHGKRASNGDVYDMYLMTAAHKTLPLPCYVEVRNLQNGRRAVVRVNDRGPFKDNRIIDLSYAAARNLGIWEQGTGLVEIRVINAGHPIIPKGRALVHAEPPRPTGPVVLDPASHTRENVAPPEIERNIPPPDAEMIAIVANRTMESPSVTVPAYFLQVGAFVERANAEVLKQKLAMRLPNVRVDPAEAGGTAVYRVQIGPFNTVEASDDAVRTLRELGLSHHRIVLN
jgi:rare lipoprotein A